MKYILVASFLCAVVVSVNCENSLSFLVIGDWGGLPAFPYRTPVETAVAKQIAQYAEATNVEFVLGLGDNFYFDGVKNVEDPRFQETFNHIFNYPSLDVDWYFVAGNHDHNGNVSAQIEYSTKDKRWNFPNYFYDLKYKIPGTNTTIDIIMIDTVLLCGNSDSDYLGKQPHGPDDMQLAEDQWSWIKERITASQADYLLVAGHYPVYSIAEHGPTLMLVNNLMPLLHQYQTTAYMSGHDHNLQHLQTTGYGHTVDYFVSGAADFIDDSRAHKEAVPEGASRFYWADLLALGGFAAVNVTPSNMTLSFIASNGKVLYKQTMFPRKL